MKNVTKSWNDFAETFDRSSTQRDFVQPEQESKQFAIEL